MKVFNIILSAAVATMALAVFDASKAYTEDAVQHGVPAADTAGPGADEDKIAKARGLYFSGMNMVNHGNYQKAVDDFEKAIELNPNHYQTHLMLGKAYTGVDRHKDSLGILHKATELEPSNPKAYDMLMELYLYLKEPKKSLETAKKAISSGVDEDSLPALGWAYYQFGKNDEAEARFKRDLELYGEFYGAYRNLGLVSFARGDYEKAAEYLEKAEKFEPENQSLPYIKALTYEKLGRESDVRREVELFKSRNTDLSPTMEKYNKLYFPHADPGSVSGYISPLKEDGSGADNAKPAGPEEGKGE